MEKQEAIEKLLAMPCDGDAEILHGQADDILLDFIESRGHLDVREAFEAARDNVGFWYA